MDSTYVEIFIMPNFIDASKFTPEDLNIYIESVEIIARIERERQELRQLRKNNKLKASELAVEDKVNTTPEAISTEDSSETDEDLIQLSKPVCPKQLCSKLIASQPDLSAGQSSDENYFSGASRSESPTGSIHIDGIAPLPSTDSGTESESGVYKLRPRSFLMTSPKYRTTRARIIGLVLKKEYADGGSLDERQERRERVLEGLLRADEMNKCESLRAPSKKDKKPIPGKGKGKPPTAEMRFIDKALRYLTL